MNKIILEAETKFEDKELRDWVSKLNTKIDTLNERTKIHTLDIRELKKSLKEIKGWNESKSIKLKGEKEKC